MPPMRVSSSDDPAGHRSGEDPDLFYRPPQVPVPGLRGIVPGAGSPYCAACRHGVDGEASGAGGSDQPIQLSTSREDQRASPKGHILGAMNLSSSRALLRHAHTAFTPAVFGAFLGAAFLGTALLSVPAAFPQTAPASAKIDAAFEAFWSAASPDEAARRVDAIVKSGVTFDEAMRRLKAGRTYAAQKSGVVFQSNKTSDGVEHNFAVNVPANYDPSRRYQVRFQLHGGIGASVDNHPRNNGEIGALAGAEQIYVLPYAWEDAPWWGDDQILNLDAIVDSLKRTWNVDENRVVLSGVSDGATGAYFIAMRETTPFASFLPLNGFIMVLSNGEIDDGQIFPGNLVNKPLFVINGGKDRLYPTSIVEPYTRHLMSSGVEIEYHPQPEGEHNTKWWPEMKEPFEKFVAAHPRAPHPAKLSWEAADPAHNRAHWLVIEELGQAAGEAREMADANLMQEGQRRSEMFGDRARTGGHGRVDAVRAGNTVTASTKGVTAFTLLLSPDVFDFEQPVKVVANGKEVFNAKVARSLPALLNWAARDNDRTMLYGAELKIQMGK